MHLTRSTPTPPTLIFEGLAQFDNDVCLCFDMSDTAWQALQAEKRKSHSNDDKCRELKTGFYSPGGRMIDVGKLLPLKAFWMARLHCTSKLYGRLLIRANSQGHTFKELHWLYYCVCVCCWLQ